jgi:hypothetical protein
MKLPPAESGTGSYTLFEFIPRCPESRDFHFVPTSSEEFKFKDASVVISFY